MIPRTAVIRAAAELPPFFSLLSSSSFAFPCYSVCSLRESKGRKREGKSRSRVTSITLPLRFGENWIDLQWPEQLLLSFLPCFVVRRFCVFFVSYVVRHQSTLFSFCPDALCCSEHSVWTGARARGHVPTTTTTTTAQCNQTKKNRWRNTHTAEQKGHWRQDKNKRKKKSAANASALIHFLSFFLRCQAKRMAMSFFSLSSTRWCQI